MTPFLCETFKGIDERSQFFKDLKEQIYGVIPPETIPPESQCFCVLDEGKPLAFSSVNVVTDFKGEEEAVGVLGYYESTDPQAGALLLETAKAFLEEQGVSRIVGPMNGSTWGTYRIPYGHEEVPCSLFLGEPWSCESYHNDFLSAGFQVCETYQSRIVPTLNPPSQRELQLAERLEKNGISIRPIDLSRYEEEMRGVYEMSLDAFSGNKLFKKISYEEFSALYEKIRPLMDPKLVYLAYSETGKLLGFSFAYPDLLSCNSRGRPERVVLKTLARDPSMVASGVGVALFDRIHHAAYEEGYKSVIHALMHDDHRSVRLSVKRTQSQLIRRYGLYDTVLPH